MTIAKNRNREGVDQAEAALTMAVAVLVERIRSLPKEDKADLFELSKALIVAENEEERESAARAFQEILDQKSARVMTFAVEEEPGNMERWLSFVSRQIKTAREEAELTQEALEQLTGLPQSHISRLENGVHSPSASTLEKIAKATGKPVAYFDPSHPDD
jgi:DNA-binding XRE family transcriptional regulator